MNAKRPSHQKGPVVKQKPPAQTSVIYAPVVRTAQEDLVYRVCKRHFDNKEYDQSTICKYPIRPACPLIANLCSCSMYSCMDLGSESRARGQTVRPQQQLQVPGHHAIDVEEAGRHGGCHFNRGMLPLEATD